MKKVLMMLLVVIMLAFDVVAEAEPPEMVFIHGGEFEMGDHHGDGIADELPVHTVYVDSFFMSKHEITNQQYCDYLNDAYPAKIKVVSGVVYAADDGSNNYPYCDTHSHDADSQIDYSGGVFSVRTKGGRDMSDDPMVQVSWYGAVSYCNWRSQQEGKELCYDTNDPNWYWPCDFSKYGYRIPTEAEWEYAARGGNHNPYYRFPWGDTISHSQANYYADPCGFSYDVNPTSGYHPDYDDGISPLTSPIDSFLPNGYGVYGKADNISEWCNDRFDPYYYETSPYYNPTGPSSGTNLVHHGGAWVGTAYYCRVSYRGSTIPVHRDRFFGFRVVIACPINVLTPNGGETLISGSTYLITWAPVIPDINHLKLEYSASNGVGIWNVIDPCTPNDSEYEWTVPEVTSNQCLIRISDVNDPNVYDTSDDVFTIFVCRAGYDYVNEWGSFGTGDGELNNPFGVAVDSSGYTYVTDEENHRVQKFDSDGNLVGWWGGCDDPGHAGSGHWHDPGSGHNPQSGSGDGQFIRSTGIAIDSSDNIYVVDYHNYRIQKFKTDGTFVIKWGNYGNGDGQFNQAHHIAVGPSGDVYVCDTFNHRVQKFTSSGGFITKWGSYGNGDGQFKYTHGIDVDSYGYVYVSEDWNHRVQKFDPNGNLVGWWGGCDDPGHAGSGHWHDPGSGHNPQSGSGYGQFNRVEGVAVDSSDHVYVCEIGGSRIQKFTSDGEFITKWGSPGTGDGQFNSPYGIEVTSLGYVYIVDLGNDRIQLFEPEGPLQSDLYKDCYIDFKDFAVLANEWLECGNPFDPDCGY